jgi:hypothetical protein
MELGAIVFIIPWKALYMFRVFFAPIIRSVLKLYMQFLVQSCFGMVSDPVCYKMIRSRERPAHVVTKLGLTYNSVILQHVSIFVRSSSRSFASNKYIYI